MRRCRVRPNDSPRPILDRHDEPPLVRLFVANSELLVGQPDRPFKRVSTVIMFSARKIPELLDVSRIVELRQIRIPQVGTAGVGLASASPSAMISATIPSIRSRLRFFDGFQLSAASVSNDTLLAIHRSTGLPP